MASSTQTSKLEADVEIKASPEQFYEMFVPKPHHVHHTCYDKIQGCDLHEGVGTIVQWNYVLGGKAKKAKDVMEAVDPDKNLVTFGVIEGDLMKEYKSFIVTIQVSSKREDSGSIVHWTLEYKKLHDGIAHPESMLQFVQDVSKDIDAHLTQASQGEGALCFLECGMHAGLPKYIPVNLKGIETAGFQEGDEVSLETAKILGDGELKLKLNLKARAFSSSAKEMLEAAGCSLTVLPRRKKWVKPSVAKNLARAEEYFAKKRAASSSDSTSA